jgi:putative oxidoreductase
MISTPVISPDLALALARAAAGLIVAAHGAQKAFGVWGGPGFSGWTQAMGRMGLRPPTLWAYLSAGAELVGGIAFALGLLVPVAGALLTMQMAVAMQRVHWAKGFWNGKGGIEFSLLLAAIAAIGGIADPGVYSLDRLFGLPTLGAGVYLLVLAAAGIAYVASSRSRIEPSGTKAA